MIQALRLSSDPTGRIGAAVMAGFGCYAGWRFAQTGLIFFLLLVLRDSAAAWLLAVRNPAARGGRPDMLAYASCALPLFYFSSTSTNSALSIAASLLTIAGFALSTVALFELGTSFGISPAARGRVSGGVYKVLAHPMYTGYATAELGMVLLNPLNSVIYALSLVLYGRRAKAETAFFNRSSG